MYNIVKDVINGGNFELGNITKKIKALWLDDSLSDDEMAELINLAQDRANFKNSLDLYEKVIDLDKRVRVVEEKLAEKDKVEDGTEDNTEVIYPEYEVGKVYYSGDMITFEGAIYMCIAPEGQVCVWSPSEYPAYWEIIAD